jgi:hypothetical protein
LSILKDIKTKGLRKVKLNYLNKKVWFLVIKQQKKLSVKNFSVSYTNKFFKIYSKLQKLNFFFINYVQTFFFKKEKYRAVYLKNQKKLIFVKQNFIEKKNLKKNQVYLNVTFAKKNTFFNVSSPKGKTVYLTTVVREGYIGKKRKAYTSIFSVASLINKLISNFYIKKYCNVCIIYKGWSRFRSAIGAAFNKKKIF